LNLHTDPELASWVYGILHAEPVPAGAFLQHLAQAAVRADAMSYVALRPSLILLSIRFSSYECKCGQRQA
jgi:hypothetical protein